MVATRPFQKVGSRAEKREKGGATSFSKMESAARFTTANNRNYDDDDDDDDDNGRHKNALCERRGK